MDAPGSASHKSRKRKRQPQSRKDYLQEAASRRDRVNDTRRKRTERGEGRPIWADEYTEEEIRDDPRKPKRKVALIFGYSGTGYHGSQIMSSSRTIEGDLFRACVRAGAVSKANSEDPKKVQWVRCSRTDRGVHAAANVISARLSTDEEDIIERINEHLPPQIRVWGYERLNNSFNAHQQCEGRVYQYWIPTYCFIPPHPRSFLGKQLAQLARESGKEGEYQERQREVADFWAKAEEDYVAPVLSRFDTQTGQQALDQIFSSNPPPSQSVAVDNGDDSSTPKAAKDTPMDTKPSALASQPEAGSPAGATTEASSPVEDAIRAIKDAYKAARRAYRIDEARLKRLRAVMQRFQGTHNFWNYTANKDARDPSTKRHLRACTANAEPLDVAGTEWLPIDLHGQSFMLNQIRKMVCMAAMVVRCGADPAIIATTFTPQRLTIPRAPPTGLLLEHPIFDSHNRALDRLRGEGERSRIDFDKFSASISPFKRRFIVEPLQAIEEREAVYYNFFASLDSLHSTQLLYLSSEGVSAVEQNVGAGELVESTLVDDTSAEEEEAPSGSDKE